MKKFAVLLILAFALASCAQPTPTLTNPPPTVTSTSIPTATDTPIPPTPTTDPTSTTPPPETATPIPSLTPTTPVSALPSPTIASPLATPTPMPMLPETGGEVTPTGWLTVSGTLEIDGDVTETWDGDGLAGEWKFVPDEPEGGSLGAFLACILGGPAVGIAVAGWMESKEGKTALAWIEIKLSWLEKIQVVRYTAMAATGIISCALYWLALQLGAGLDPLTGEVAGTLFGISFGASQARHARMKARA